MAKEAMMNEAKSYRVDYFLLSNEWNEPGVEHSRISYVVSGGDTKEEHEKIVEEVKKKLLSDNDDDYTSWVFTASRHKDMGGAASHHTVLHFRIRDAW